jgi:DNA-binding transcriptional LysR family regulator
MSRAALRRYFRHGLFPQLLVFEAVARLGSVTRAAEELHLAQPTVSLQLKKLARTLELALFVQQGRRLVLTPAGAALRESCAELFTLFTRMDARLTAFRSHEAQALALAPELPARAAHGQLRLARDDGVYLFELEVEGLPVIKGAAHARPRS